MSLDLITSRQNPKIRQARALRQRKARDESGLFLVEGIRHVGEAVQLGARLEYLCYAPGLLTSDFARSLVEDAQARGVACYPCSPDVFASLAEKEDPAGILAVVRQPGWVLEDLTPERHPWLAAVVAPQDPGNIGTLLRTLDAVGANGLVLLDGGADPWHPTAVRASMGTVFSVPAVQVSFQHFARWAQEQGYAIFGTSARGSQDYRQVRYARPCVLLLGSERDGLSEAQRAACHHLVRLPMVGRGSSLNLSVAAGVLLYAMMEG